ncbi:MAG: PiT family inorganic phosphate transporter [Chitinophagaceae bacterium]|nr:PiT family inorganic phosphate transporter [Chitinophagaceae bacterium]
MTFLVVIIVLALVFDYINGFHDAANSIATIVSTKVLTPFQAVLWAAFFNFVAFYIFQDHAVANTIGKTVQKDFITLPVIFSGLVAAIIWNLLTWWFGIPSSSSHTLIGGFAGAAITAAFMKDSTLTLAQIVDSGKIGKTILFILLAPLVGMLISMFYTVVMVIRNTWVKTAILALTGIALWFMFAHFQVGKVKENLGKFYRIEKNAKSADEEKIKLAKETDPAKQAEIQKKIEEYEGKVAYGEAALAASEPFISALESSKSDSVVAHILAHADIKKIEQSRLGDKLKTYFKLEKLKVLSTRSESDKNQYDLAKAAVDSLMPLTKKYHEWGADSMLSAMIALHNVNPADIDNFKKNMKMDTPADLKKELEKSNNKTLRYFLLGGLFIFILSFFYVEKMREPSAARSANLFKKLQLLSSAGFSIGHGGNDAQKVMGIIAAAFVANGTFNEISEALKVYSWIPLACYAAIGLGTLSGGWKIVKTMGTKITKVNPLEGVCAETAGATTLFLTEQMGIPVSTTHTITGAIIGVGATKRLSAVRWGVTVNLLWAWILTIPISAILAGIVFLITNALS